MKIKELFNSRVSYQVVVTFDLENADTSAYKNLQDALSGKLKLEKYISISKEDGGGKLDLPDNTLAALWEKDKTEKDTRLHFEKEIKSIFDTRKLRGRFLVVVAQNWSANCTTI
jgi:hypothetical protein